MTRPVRPTVASEIKRYLRTGAHDPCSSAWTGNIVERERRRNQALLHALTREVRRRAGGRLPPVVRDLDLATFTRNKVGRMVEGLFPRAEWGVVLRLLERSVVFLTPERIEPVLLECRWLGTAWDLANIYLASAGADLLADDAPCLVGLSEETTCYVSTEYFSEKDPFADFVVHEAAHIFHNCKRAPAGLPQTSRREWLLEIDYRKRETFAYSCEAYSRIVESAHGLRARAGLGAQFAEHPRISDARVDPEEIADVVRAACAARNGWKVILRRCGPAATAQVVL